MFTPSTFKEEDPEKLLTIMQENAFATIVTTDEHGVPIATPLPFLVKKMVMKSNCKRTLLRPILNGNI